MSYMDYMGGKESNHETAARLICAGVNFRDCEVEGGSSSIGTSRT